jgi:nickel-dependent lactate racemase
VVASGTDTLHAAAFGTPEDAWAACAEIAAETHVTYLDTPVRRVLSIMPTKYEDIWTAAKGFYKLEPIVADGGEVIIYAPHITQVSVMHPQITEIGYHRRDYFPSTVGPLQGPAVGRPGALNPPSRTRHLGSRSW